MGRRRNAATGWRGKTGCTYLLWPHHNNSADALKVAKHPRVNYPPPRVRTWASLNPVGCGPRHKTRRRPGFRRLGRFRNWCRPKRRPFSWFSSKENHTSRSLSGHSNCETALERYGAPRSGVERRLSASGQLTEHTALTAHTPPAQLRD
jgi:hypothetical protein